MNNTIKNLLLNLLPLFIVLILSLLWFIKDFGYYIAHWQILFVSILMPIYLLIINITYTCKNNKYLFLHKMILMILFEYISSQLGFWAWKSTMSQKYIDTETLMVVNFEWQMATFIIIIVGIVFQIIRFIKYRKNLKAN